MACAYPVPTVTFPVVHETEQTIRRSRFLAQGCRCSSREDARALVAQVRLWHPGATHHCWAYVAGPPRCTASVGSSDDGEPHGTAGRPMLNTLLHCGIGQICVVISRWFGGIKLGTGGLVRAYSDGVAENTASMPTMVATVRRRWRLDCSYGDLAPVKRALEFLGATPDNEIYGEAVSVYFQLSEEMGETLARAVADASGGRGRLTPADGGSQGGNIPE